MDYLGSDEPEVYLDNMFHVWATRTEFRALMLSDNGGIGTYKWDEKVSNPLRDALFVDSWNHYCRDGATTALRGPSACA